MQRWGIHFLRGLLGNGFGLIQTIKTRIRADHIDVWIDLGRVLADGLQRIFQGLLKISQLPIRQGKIIARDEIIGIGLLVKFVGLNTFFDLAVVGVVVSSDIKPLALAGAVAKFEGADQALSGKAILADVAIMRC